MIMIDLPFPPSSNTAYPTNRRGGGRHLSKEGSLWKTHAVWTIKAVFGLTDVPPCFALHIALWMPDKRRRDIDNYVKLAKDALCEALGIDDDWQRIPEITIVARGIDRDNPRCELVMVPK